MIIGPRFLYQVPPLCVFFLCRSPAKEGVPIRAPGSDALLRFPEKGLPIRPFRHLGLWVF